MISSVSTAVLVILCRLVSLTRHHVGRHTAHVIVQQIVPTETWPLIRRDVRGLIAARPELSTKRRTDMPAPYLGTETVQAYTHNVSAYIRTVRCGVATRRARRSPVVQHHADGAAALRDDHSKAARRTLA